MENIIFDKDGVLFDTERVALQCWKELAAAYDFPDIEKLYPSFVGKTHTDVEATLKEHCEPGFPYCEMTNDFFAMLSHRIDHSGPPLKPFVRELLSFLKANGCHLALASSAYVPVIRKELSMTGLDRYFDVIVGGDMVSRGKPAPDIFLMAGQLLHSAAQDTYVIEDSEYGILAAHAAKMRPVMVPDLIEPSPDIRAICEHIFPDLREVRLFFAGEMTDKPIK